MSSNQQQQQPGTSGIQQTGKKRVSAAVQNNEDRWRSRSVADWKGLGREVLELKWYNKWYEADEIFFPDGCRAICTCIEGYPNCNALCKQIEPNCAEGVTPMVRSVVSPSKPECTCEEKYCP